MIRAVYRGGSIEPVDAVPPTWTEGTELFVERTVGESAAALTRWHDELEAHAAEVLPEDIAELNAALSKADQEAKAWVRREMGLQP
jgi:prefoldin subunit 5